MNQHHYNTSTAKVTETRATNSEHKLLKLMTDWLIDDVQTPLVEKLWIPIPEGQKREVFDLKQTLDRLFLLLDHISTGYSFSWAPPRWTMHSLGPPLDCMFIPLHHDWHAIMTDYFCSWNNHRKVIQLHHLSVGYSFSWSTSQLAIYSIGISFDRQFIFLDDFSIDNL